MWNAAGISEDEQRLIEHRAEDDAVACAGRLWRDEIPNYTGETKPLAVDATYAFLARLRQESAGLPGWVLKSGQQMMRDYIQWIGNRYFYAFWRALDKTIGQDVPRYHRTPHTTPLPQSKHITPRLLNPRRDRRNERHDEQGAI